MRGIVSLALLVVLAVPLWCQAEGTKAGKVTTISFGLQKNGASELIVSGDGPMPRPAISRDDSRVIIEIPEVSMDATLPFGLPLLVKAISYEPVSGGMRIILTMNGSAILKRDPDREGTLVFSLSSQVFTNQEQEEKPASASPAAAPVKGKSKNKNKTKNRVSSSQESSPADEPKPKEEIGQPSPQPQAAKEEPQKKEEPLPLAQAAAKVEEPAPAVPETPRNTKEETAQPVAEPQAAKEESPKVEPQRLEPLVQAPEAPRKDENLLTLEQCIQTAVTSHPDIAAASGTVGVNQSRIGQAASNYYPQIGLSAAYTRQSPVSSFTNSSLDQYTSTATLSQTVYDFGKTSAQVNIQRLNTNSSRSDMENTIQQVILNVRNAYYGLLKAQRDRVVAAETVAQFEQRLQQAQGFYEVGRSPKFDVTKAEVDLSNARLNLIKAESALNVARASLRTAMGIPDTAPIGIVDTLSFLKYEITLDGAIQRAYEKRSDLKSLKTKIQAAETSIALAKKDYYPVLSANANYEMAGNRFPLEDGWSAGMTVTFPIFSGFLTKYQVEEARSNLSVIKANEDSLKLGILFEIQQAYLNLRDAESSISTAEVGVRQAKENLELAQGRYEVGVGNPIEVSDAVVAYANARSSYIQALYNYKTSQASLEKAMGER